MERATPSILRYGLGGLWLTAAGLQMQPGMFHDAFFGQLSDSTMPSSLQIVIEGSAPWIQPALRLTQLIYGHFPIITNTLVIVIQLLLAAGLLLPVSERWVKRAAVGSIVWGLLVWTCGEGLSGLGSLGDMTYFDGFPGSALLYAFSGFLLLLPHRHWSNGRVMRLGTRSLAVLFFVCSLLQILPINGQWDVASQMSIFANSGFQTQPSILSSPVMAFTMWVSTHATLLNWLEAISLFLAGCATWYWWKMPVFVRVLTYMWLLWTWWFGMDFGYLFSGLSTDLNSAPVFIILLVSLREGRLWISGQLPSSVSASRPLQE